MLEVAKLIDDPPPPWLVLMLEQFAVGPKTTKVDLKSIVDEMDRACTVLLLWLPAWEHMPFGMQWPQGKVLASLLSDFQTDLARLRKRRGGRPMKFAQTTCAAVVVEAWRLCHGTVPLRSDRLYEACQAYWEACGGAPLDASPEEYWRGYCAKPRPAFIAEVMERCKTLVK